MSPQLIIALAIAASSFFGGWTVNSWYQGKKEVERVKQILVEQKQSAAVAIRRVDNVAQAQNESNEREIILRDAALNARTALDGLRGSTARALRDAAASQAACLNRAATLGELLEASTDKYRELAEKAGRHANDVKTLTDSWPK